MDKVPRVLSTRSQNSSFGPLMRHRAIRIYRFAPVHFLYVRIYISCSVASLGHPLFRDFHAGIHHACPPTLLVVQFYIPSDIAPKVARNARALKCHDKLPEILTSFVISLRHIRVINARASIYCSAFYL